MVDLGSVNASRGWSRGLSRSATRLISIHFLTEHTRDMILFVHYVVTLIDEDTDLILQGRDLIIMAMDCSS